MLISTLYPWKTSKFYLVLILMLLSACASINPVQQQPFARYQQAIADLKTQSDQILQAAADTEFQQFKKHIASSDTSALLELQLSFPTDSPFAWCYGNSGSNDDDTLTTADHALDADTAPSSLTHCASGGPLFAQMTQLQQTVASLNEQLLNYANTLVNLAGADSATQFDATQEAQQFEQASQKLTSQINQISKKPIHVNPKGLALFSTVAANLANDYIEHQRKEDLAKVLSQSLPAMEAYADSIKTAMLITAENLKAQYQEQSFQVFKQIATQNGGDKTQALTQILQLNQGIQQHLKALENIVNSYSALPNTQRQLIIATQNNSPPNLAQLISHIDGIKQQYEALKAEAN